MTEPKKARKPQRRKALERPMPLNMDLMSPKRQCSATSKRTGEQCKRFCAPGARTCVWHGSATRRSKTAAAKRIADASGYAADMLADFMADPEVDMKIRVQVAQDLLTRAGISGKQQVEVEVRNWEDVLDTVLVDIPEEPSSLSPASNIEDAVIVEEPRKLEAAREAARDEEMEERESQRRRRAIRGKSPAALPSDQAAVDRKLDRMSVAGKAEHERFLAERLNPPKPARYKRNRP